MFDRSSRAEAVSRHPSRATAEDRLAPCGRIAPHPRYLIRPAVWAVLAGALLGCGTVGLALIGPGAPASGAGSYSTGPGGGGVIAPGSSSATPAVGGTCNSPTYLSASSLLIPLPNPADTLASGGNLTVAFQVSVNASQLNASGMIVTFPSVFATFPLTAGSLQVYFLPTSAPLKASGWASVATMSKTLSVHSAVSFLKTGSATLSTQKLAVMAPANYTKLTLAFRWSWSYLQPNGTTGQSGWSVPTPVDHLPAQLRSIFYPAPFTSLLNTSGPTAVIGTNFTATLGGNVAGRYFLLEMEFPGSGKVVQAQGVTAAANAVTLGVYIPVLGYTHSLASGSYLVHIHDACGALLVNKSILAVYAPSASVHFSITPTTCSARFNGTSWFNGSTATVHPSVVAFSMSVGCAGHSFKSWGGSGGLHVNNGTSLLVSASGTFTVNYT